MFNMLCTKHVFLVHRLRIHSVHSVINNPTQLFGRGCPYIFYKKYNFVITLRFYGAPKGKPAVKLSDFWDCCATTCVLRTHSVQSVTNNPTQLSGRGFPRIFYITLICHNVTVVCVVLPKWKPSREILWCLRLLCKNMFIRMLFEDPFCTQCNK